MKVIKLTLSNKDMDRLYAVLADVVEINEAYINDEDDIDEINALSATNRSLDNILKQLEAQNGND